MRTGVPVAPGVAVGRAYCLHQAPAPRAARHLNPTDLPGEVARLDAACAAATRELDATIARARGQFGDEAAAVFQAHRLLLRDPGLLGKVKDLVRTRRLDAAGALDEVVAEYEALFARRGDAYLRERLADLRDVAERLRRHLAGGPAALLPAPTGPLVLVVPALLPSHVALAQRLPLAGILTETGGTTGHAAILARSLGIPAVSGLDGILDEVHTGDLVALDGRQGAVHVNPGPEVEAAFRLLQREYVRLRDCLRAAPAGDAVSADGVPVELLANVNWPDDALLACRAGAAGVGLYRTEYLFLTSPDVPDEDAQAAAYRAVIEAAPNHAVTVRTLDLGGGDKQVAYLGGKAERNPALGCRSIRLIPAHPEFFRTQLRAILRAARHGRVGLLFPMVSAVEEVVALRRLVGQAKDDLRRRGVPFAEEVPLGAMLEVPAAALCVEDLLDEVNFLSIGSNDLVQYLMAADRDNPRVAHLCEPFSPGLYRLLAQVLAACAARGKPVTLCGEMAARPRCFLPLFGMGLRRLSMSPAFLPSVRALVRRTTLAAAEEVARTVLRLHTAAAVRAFLTQEVQKAWPEVDLFDTNGAGEEGKTEERE